MIVLHVHNEITNKGGAEVYLGALQAELPNYGYTSYWVGIQNNDRGYKFAEAGGDWKSISGSHIKYELTNWIRSRNIELICLHNLFDSDLAGFFISLCPVIKFSHSPVIVCPGRDKFWRKSGCPCIIPYGLHCFLHIYTEGCSNRNPVTVVNSWTFVRDELKRAKNDYRKIIVMSDYNYRLLLECGVQSNKISINPYFTPYKKLQVNGKRKNETKYLLFIGRIVAGKGVLEMISSVEPILKDNPDVHLNIIGDGLLINEARELVISKGIAGKVTFYGWISHDDINTFIDECYLIVFPSTYPESFGIVGIEAMMSAKPVVAFNEGGVSTWLKDNMNGFLVPSADIVQMREAIRILISNKEVYAKMCETGREMALASYLPAIHISRLDKVFRESLNSEELPHKLQIVSSE